MLTRLFYTREEKKNTAKRNDNVQMMNEWYEANCEEIN